MFSRVMEVQARRDTRSRNALPLRRMTLMLTEEAQGLLRAAAKASLGEVIDRLHRDHPQAFHTEDTLNGRRFLDRPLRDEPCAFFVRNRSGAA